MRLRDTQVVVFKLKVFLLYFYMALSKFLLGNLNLDTLLKLLLSFNLFVDQNGLLPRLIDIDGFIDQNAMLVSNNRLDIRISPGTIGHPDLLFILNELPTVPFLDCSILLLPFSNLINKYRVSLGNLYLLFKTLLFVLEPAEVIFDHLSLDLFLFQVESLLKLTGAGQSCSLVRCGSGMIQIIGQNVAEAVLVAGKLFGCDLSLGNDTVLAIEEPVL